MKKNFAIIGLSIFGATVATELRESGHNVVVVDIDHEKINNIRDKVTSAIIADVTDQDVIRELEVKKFDTIILCIGDNFEAAIFALALLKQEGAEMVIAQAKTALQKQILFKLGADEVVQPDRDMAERLSKRISMSNISDMFDFKGSTIADLKVKKEYDGKSLRQLDLRRNFNITVLLIRKPGKDPEPVWDPDMILRHGDEITVIGKEDDIIRAFQE
ncbi:MAG: TrkA family potassium uptake protein [Victivallales bacterium]|nr:TrkA family potassium uptake protein [Victivallales bacterium]